MIIYSEYTKQKRKEREEFIKEFDSILSNKKLSDYEKEINLKWLCHILLTELEENIRVNGINYPFKWTNKYIEEVSDDNT
tara:strand:+ start:666 stop:905 length:240 start_codon:yes stop_codon:yes gene_type:complete